MADFCASCVVSCFGTERTGNDFAGWLDGLTARYAWGLCDGCGEHLIDNSGERRCGEVLDRDARPGIGGDCPGCTAPDDTKEGAT